jgi:hypothetical protein
MAHVRAWWAAAALATALCLGGVLGVGAVVAGAGAAAPKLLRQSGPAVNPRTALVPGTYTWIGDNSTLGTITFAGGNTWTSSYDNDSGEWVEGATSFAMDMTGGHDGPAGCVFAAKVGVGGTSIVKGAFSCPGTGYSGSWSASPAVGASPATTHGDVFALQGVAPRASLVLGTYKWFIGTHHDGTIAYAGGNAWSSTYQNNGGSWVQGGTTIAMTMTSGADGTGGCIFAGKVAKTGTAVGSAGKPGAWICPGYSSSGTWYAS